jgi:hypothetical protein
LVQIRASLMRARYSALHVELPNLPAKPHYWRLELRLGE